MVRTLVGAERATPGNLHADDSILPARRRAQCLKARPSSTINNDQNYHPDVKLGE
jgi:hypothetical protein